MAKVIRLDDVRFPYERRLEELLRAYRDAQRHLAVQLQISLMAGRSDLVAQRRAQLAAALQVLQQLGRETDPLAQEIVREAWTQSAARTGELIADAGPGMTPIEAHFTGVSYEAISSLEATMLGRLDDARRQVGRRIEDVFARAGRRQVMLSLLGADGSPQKMASGLVASLRKQGLTGFIDRSGRRWALKDYAEMAMRTTTREAVVQGATARMLAQDVNVARVSRHAKACPTCKPWEGVLVSLDGRTRELDGEAVATLDAMPNGGPPFHPRCKHTLLPEVASIQRLRRERLGAV